MGQKTHQAVRAMEVGTGPIASPDHITLGCKAATSIINHEHLTSGPNICSQPCLRRLCAAQPQGVPGMLSFLLLSGLESRGQRQPEHSRYEELCEVAFSEEQSLRDTVWAQAGTPQVNRAVGSRYWPRTAIGAHFRLCPHNRHRRGTEEDLISSTLGSRQAWYQPEAFHLCLCPGGFVSQ